MDNGSLSLKQSPVINAPVATGNPAELKTVYPSNGALASKVKGTKAAIKDAAPSAPKTIEGNRVPVGILNHGSDRAHTSTSTIEGMVSAKSSGV